MKNDLAQSQLRRLSKTINIHLTRSCNFACAFCYAGFSECDSASIPPDKLRSLLEAISQAVRPLSRRKRKVNLAGGEPLLDPKLPDMIQFAQELGMTTSIVTNGSLLSHRLLNRLAGWLNICAVTTLEGWRRDRRPGGIFLLRCCRGGQIGLWRGVMAKFQ